MALVTVAMVTVTVAMVTVMAVMVTVTAGIYPGRDINNLTDSGLIAKLSQRLL
jgi:hypothetical protein